MNKVAAIYLAIGMLISWRFIAWKVEHCPKPIEISLTDGIVLAIAWGVAIPIAVVYGLSRENSNRTCR